MVSMRRGVVAVRVLGKRRMSEGREDDSKEGEHIHETLVNEIDFHFQLKIM